MNQEFFRLAIANPCSQAWDNMHSREEGRYCDSCRKTVTDFTSKSNEEIQSFFLQRNIEAVCGRFNTAQLAEIRIHVPNYILQKPITAWKKYLLVLLICFAKDLLPPNAVVGFSQAACGQTKHAYVKAKKHRAKRKKLHYKWYIAEELKPQMMEIMGYTASVREPQTSMDKYLNPPVSNGGLLISNSSIPEKKEPIKEDNTERMTFVLPAAISKRKRFKKD